MQNEPSPSERHRRLADELLQELTAWSPRERMRAFRRWQRGPFSLVHLNVVTTLEVDGPLPMSHLAERLGVSDASATGIVDRMEQRQLVVRRHDLGDRRLVTVHLADGGRDLFEKVERRRRKRLGALVDRLTDDELEAFLLGLRAMHRAREELAAEGGMFDDEATADDDGPETDGESALGQAPA
jgi:DNA-binding MarR family transcriptional regulator